MALFDTSRSLSKARDQQLSKKASTAVRQKAFTAVRSSGGIVGVIQAVQQQVEEHLGQYKDQYEIITTEERLTEYFVSCLEQGVIAIDTETTGLDPIIDKIVGLCLFTPGQKGAYIPINHISYMTQQRLHDQLTEAQVGTILRWFLEQKPVEIEMFNAKFDIRVIRNQLGVREIYCTWDGYLAARLMNENEGVGNNGLKALHRKYVLRGAGDPYSFEDLFKGLTFDNIPIQLAYLYAARDPVITHELAVFQKKYLYYDPDQPLEARRGMNGASWVFFNIEMPCVPVICDMEDNGILFDHEYAKTLSLKYGELLDEREAAFKKLCLDYRKEIEAYKRRVLNHKLDDPINISSPTQITVLLYDVLGLKSPDPKNPRGTGVEILSKIDNPIAKAVLDYREIKKLLSTYVDKLPGCVNPKDGRIHCSFNQYGADTGRMSSSDPNLQNIPSHNKDVRKMFTASGGYVLMSSDFSQQEPKCLAALCAKQGDPQLRNMFLAGKDVYSEIASLSFNVPYDECREFRPDGTTNPEGKERRTQAKSVFLGAVYGRSEASIAEQFNCTLKRAKAIKESVFAGVPAIENFEKSSLQMAREKGYVTTVCGRKRRLPDLQLPDFEIHWKSDKVDLLNFESTDSVEDVPENVRRGWLKKLRNARGYAEKQMIIKEAEDFDLLIIDNTIKIGDARRQCVNSRIQGSAADLTKLALIRLNNNQELKRLGFRLLLPIHDEVIAECPEGNAKECSRLLAETMSKAAEDILEMPIKCDVEITKQWYGTPIDLNVN